MLSLDLLSKDDGARQEWSHPDGLSTRRALPGLRLDWISPAERRRFLYAFLRAVFLDAGLASAASATGGGTDSVAGSGAGGIPSGTA